jgi:hypothetical protein
MTATTLTSVYLHLKGMPHLKIQLLYLVIEVRIITFYYR